MVQQSNVGTFLILQQILVLQKSYTSNRNSSVKITFPAIGARGNAARGILD
jgi:hypothetical protein